MSSRRRAHDEFQMQFSLEVSERLGRARDHAKRRNAGYGLLLMIVGQLDDEELLTEFLDAAVSADTQTSEPGSGLPMAFQTAFDRATLNMAESEELKSSRQLLMAANRILPAADFTAVLAAARAAWDEALELATPTEVPA